MVTGHHAHLGIDMLLLMESWCGEEIVKVIWRRRMVESEGLSKEGVSVLRHRRRLAGTGAGWRLVTTGHWSTHLAPNLTSHFSISSLVSLSTIYCSREIGKIFLKGSVRKCNKILN